MPQPWEKYAASPAPPPSGDGPWNNYGNSAEPSTPPPIPQAMPGNIFTSGHPLDTFRANVTEAETPRTPQERAQHGVFSNTLHDLGRGFTETLAHPIAHPLDTLAGVGKTIGGMAMHPNQYDPDNPINQMVGNTVQDFQDNGAASAIPHAMGQLGGAAIGGEVAGPVVGNLAKPLRAAGNLASSIAERVGGYTSPVIDPVLQDASKLATAIRPQTGIPHGFEGDLAEQFPAVKAFAQETGNPMHSQWEGSVAARGSAERGLQHFNDNLLGPNADAQVPVGSPTPFQGFTGPNAEQKFMTLGQINSRIGEINDLMRPANNAKTAGAAMTAMERQGLEQEGNMLRQKLYNELSQRTGVEPEAIKGLREGYGKQFNIADTIDAARRARLGQIGAGAEGTSVPLDKSSLLQKAFTKVRGGQQYLADRNFRTAASPFAPQPVELPIPKYPQQLQGDQFNNPFINRSR